MSTNRWDERFRRVQYLYGEEPNAFLVEHVHRLPKGGKVLCLASGEGRNAVYLAGLGFQVTAVDGSEVGMEKACQLAARRGVVMHTLVSDLCDFEPETGAWDAVVAVWCHLSSAFRPTVHHRIVRGLRRGGVLVLEDDHPTQVRNGAGQVADLDLLARLDELRGNFSRLQPLHTFEGERDVQERSVHSGPRFVTQFVAKKVRR